MYIKTKDKEAVELERLNVGDAFVRSHDSESINIIYIKVSSQLKFDSFDCISFSSCGVVMMRVPGHSPVIKYELLGIEVCKK